MTKKFIRLSVSIPASRLIILILSFSVLACGSKDDSGPNEEFARGDEIAVRAPSYDNDLSEGEFDLIQRFYNMRAEYASINKLYAARKKELIPDLYTTSSTKLAQQEKYRLILENLDEEFTPLRNDLYRKHEIDEKEFIDVATLLAKNPKKIELFKSMGGVIPKVKIEKRSSRESYKERLEKAKIKVDLSNPSVIHDALSSEGSIVQLDVIKALGDVDDASAAGYLKRFLGSENKVIQIAAAESMCKLGEENGIPVLVDTIGSESVFEVFKLGAISALGQCPDNSGIDEALLGLIKEGQDRNVRLYAAIEFQKRAKIEHLSHLEKMNEIELDESIKATNYKTIRELQYKKEMREY